MPQIAALDERTIGQIAAGEIVERPLSVVKELVENAVDAGARRIEVSLLRGGTERIEVSDDGAGIAIEDLALAPARHATSKLRDAEELHAVATLGFRGEGLASIAAVARLTIVSRTPGEEIGAKIVAYGDRIEPILRVAAPAGTSAVAEGLFENVPVRREYLKSPAAELARVNSWLSTFALAYPEIAFTFGNDGEQHWAMPATADPRERLAALFGREAAKTMLAIDASATASMHGGLRGFISAPGNERADRRMQILFVNRRLLRSSLLAGAWSAGYQTFSMLGRQPYGVLMLDLPPEHVDANVHPTKSDVRLRFGSQVADSVRHAIAATLRGDARERLTQTLGSSPGEHLSLAPPERYEQAHLLHYDPELTNERGAVPNGMRVLAQVDATYILATDGSTILLVDQHAAHERIAYERIVAAAAAHAPSEPLLVPTIVELDSVQSERLEPALELLREGGLAIEPFGERSFRLTATPAGYGARAFDLAGFLDDLAEDAPQRDVRERVWASLACHSVTTAGERLAFAEMVRMLDDLQHCANPMHCPHGRPTMLRLEPEMVARLFKRA
ncbi:MAG: DNA mismatch repair endonuclease MutL [Candidatus Eremiobacteraeota bacterium]|nr:DNA mismatch repair endonuclease MutL [Candidatus Eremiobacteraeota bacterium]